MKNLKHLEKWLTDLNAFTLKGKSLPLVVEAVAGSATYKVCGPTITVPLAGDIFNKNSVFKYTGVDVRLPNSDVSGWKEVSRADLKAIMDSLSRGTLPVSSAVEPAVELEAEPAVEPAVELEAEPAVEPAVEPEAEPAVDLKSMSKKEIDAWASTKGIDVDGRLSKTDMIAFVESELAK